LAWEQPRVRTQERVWLHVLLFTLSVATMWLAYGPAFALSLAFILLSHEMGHYVACRRHGVLASLPYFIPGLPLMLPFLRVLPPPGTFGAVIHIRSPFPNRRALFDIGLAGPLAGFVALVPVLLLGLHEAQLVPSASVPSYAELGEPLFFQWLAGWWFASAPADSTLAIGPFGLAAWYGLLFTSLNLIPIGQLDGGHLTYALFGRAAQRLSQVVWWAYIAAMVVLGPGFLLWTVLVRMLGFRHPPTLDDTLPLGRARIVWGLIGLAVFVGSFMPAPIPITWHDLAEVLRHPLG
jgi:membrane-associated protease RseP (regulator of RpoE activity)